MSLNLDNFETQLGHATPYILTSPRSLKACAALGVSPSELVYRSIEEYEEVLCDRPLSEIYRIYDQNETKRQELLLKCREQRNLLTRNMAITQPFNAQSSEDSSIRPTARSSTRSASSSQNKDKDKRRKSSGKDGERRSSAPSNRTENKENVDVSGNNQKSPKKIHIHRNNLQPSPNSLRSRSGSSRRDLLAFQQTSDTESAEAHLNELVESHAHCHHHHHNLHPHHFGFDCNPLSLTKSTPDLRGNLDFRKLHSPRRHQTCPCNWEMNDRAVLSEYMTEFGDILDNPDLTPEDRKIMECLILKRGREMEWEKRSQEMRKVIEEERTRRWTENQLMMQNWQEKLAEKRHFENTQNEKRFLELQDKWSSSRSNLMHYLEERDKRVKKYLDDMNYKKKMSLLEKQKREAIRQLEVGRAIERIVEEDRQNRKILRDKLQRRMEEAETRKRRRERDNYRHVSEMNRMEDIKRSLKLEQLEQKARESMEELRTQIEEKEHRAKLNYLNRIRSRERTLSEGAGNRQKAIQKVQAIHSDLLKGLEDWHQKVLELQTQAMKRAEIKYSQEMTRRRVKVATDRILREERNSEMLRKTQELEAQRNDLLKAVIHCKDSKSARVKADKDRKVQISRIRAQHAAELRQQLRDKLAPESFDRKAARAEMELRIMKSVKFNPKLSFSGGGRLRCSSCCVTHNRRHGHGHGHNGHSGGGARPVLNGSAKASLSGGAGRK